jgi:tRNA (guanine-N7-)-methyltransferase
LRPTRPEEHASYIEDRRGGLRETVSQIPVAGAPFTWEVGCGHGHFLTAFATEHPNEYCLGIDISSDRIGRALRKRNRAGLRSLEFIRADAEDFLAVLPGKARFSRVFVLFPDPWPKRRHHKNRVMKPSFLAAVAARSIPNAALYFRTDHEDYFKDVSTFIRCSEAWTIDPSQQWPVDEPTVFQKRAKGHFSLVATRRPIG